MVRNDHGQVAAPAPDPAAGLRQRNKLRKQLGIERAARALFSSKGFEATTTRAIAARAGIASATFFLYFREKRDLLFHLFRDDVSAVGEEAFATMPARAALAPQLLHVFGRFFTYYGKDPSLSRVFMKELMFLEIGQRPDLLALTLVFIGRLADLVAAAVRRGEVDARVEPMQAATHVFALYTLCLVAWLNGTFPSRELVLAQLDAQLALLMRGLAAAPAPAARPRRRS